MQKKNSLETKIAPVSSEPDKNTKSKSKLTTTESIICYVLSIIMFVFSIYYFKYLYKKFDKLTLILLIFFNITTLVLIPILVILYYTAKFIYKEECENSNKIKCDLKAEEALPYILNPYLIVAFITFIIRIVKK